MAFFSSLPTFGTAADITLAELAIGLLAIQRTHRIRLLRDVSACFAALARLPRSTPRSR